MVSSPRPRMATIVIPLKKTNSPGMSEDQARTNLAATFQLTLKLAVVPILTTP
jgi:hypothetical protein